MAVVARFLWFMLWYTMAGGQFNSLNLRMTLCLLLVISQCCFFLVEQPSQSLLYRHHRFEWFTNRVAWVSGLIRSLIKFLCMRNLRLPKIHVFACAQMKVYFVRFWMLHHGAASSKRSVFWGNLSAMNDLDKGKMSRSEKETKTKVKTTRAIP